VVLLEEDTRSIAWTDVTKDGEPVWVTLPKDACNVQRLLPKKEMDGAQRHKTKIRWNRKIMVDVGAAQGTLFNL
jgi:hypothetical protein